MTNKSDVIEYFKNIKGEADRRFAAGVPLTEWVEKPELAAALHDARTERRAVHLEIGRVLNLKKKRRKLVLQGGRL